MKSKKAIFTISWITEGLPWSHYRFGFKRTCCIWIPATNTANNSELVIHGNPKPILHLVKSPYRKISHSTFYILVELLDFDFFKLHTLPFCLQGNITTCQRFTINFDCRIITINNSTFYLGLGVFQHFHSIYLMYD